MFKKPSKFSATVLHPAPPPFSTQTLLWLLTWYVTLDDYCSLLDNVIGVIDDEQDNPDANKSTF